MDRNGIKDDLSGTASRRVPVSYTHLDVYKRQVFYLVDDQHEVGLGCLIHGLLLFACGCGCLSLIHI